MNTREQDSTESTKIERGTPEVRKLALALGVSLAYVIGYPPLDLVLGDGVGTLTVVPIATVAWLYGWRAGVASAALFFPINSVLLLTFSETSWADWAGVGALGSVAGVMVGVVVGLLKQFKDQPQRGSIQTEQARGGRDTRDEPDKELAGRMEELRQAADELRRRRTTPEAPYRSARIKRDELVMAVVALSFAVLAVLFDASEAVVEWTQRYETFQVDELIVVSVGMSVTFALFLVLRTRDLRGELAERLRAEGIQARLTAILESTTDFVSISDLQGRGIYVNEAGRRMLRISPDDDVGSIEISHLHPEWARNIVLEEAIPTALREGIWRGETALRSRDGREIPVLQVVIAHRTPDGTVEYLSTIARDITENKDRESELRKRVELEDLISRISTNLIGTAIDQVEKGINDALREIGEFAGVDRSYLFRISDDGMTMDNTHEWCADGVEPQITELQAVPTSEFSYVIDPLTRSESVHIPRVADLPSEASAAKEEFEREGVQSLILVPMTRNGRMIGFIGFDSVREEKSWTDGVVLMLRLVSNMFVNLTESSRAHQELVESRSLYQGLFENASIGISLADMRGDLIAFNDAILQPGGYTREDVDEIGNISALYADPAERATTLALAETQGFLRNHEVAFLRKDGTKYDALLSLTPTEIQGKLSWQAMVEDITERKANERQIGLQASALEAAVNGIVITDRDGTIQWVNRAFTAMTGYTFEEAVGQTPRVLRSGVQGAEFYRNLWETISNGRFWEGELVNRRKDGSHYTEEMTITPVLDSQGHIAHFIAIKQDVTERRQTEERLREAGRLTWRRGLLPAGSSPSV